MTKRRTTAVVFGGETRAELARLLREDAGDLVPKLELAATGFVLARQAQSGKIMARAELLRLERSLSQAEKRLRAISTEAGDTLLAFSDTFDFFAADGLRDLQQRIADFRAFIRAALSRRKLAILPEQILASMVATALASRGLPLSKGPDGVFAAVLQSVWATVAEDAVPEDLYPYLRFAADLILRSDPTLKPRRGRRTV